MAVPRHCLCGLLAMLAIGWLPEYASAQLVVLRNETPSPLVVQGTVLVRGSVLRDRPYLLGKGESTPPVRVPPNTILTIYDAKVPSRILGQGVIPSSRENLLLAIVFDTPSTKVRLQSRPVPKGR